MAKVKKTSIYPLVSPQLLDRLTITDVSDFERTRSIRIVDIVNLLDPDGGNILIDTILSGNVYWTGVELNFRSTIIRYAISSVEYEAPVTDIVLEDAHPTLNRIDVFAVNTDNELVVITGTPAVNPLENNVEFGTQLRVAAAYIPAGSSVPQGSIVEVVYNEDLGQPDEWTGSLGVSTLQPVVDLDSTNDPHLDSVSIETDNITPSNSFSFKRDSEIDLVDFSSLAFEIKTKSAKEYSIAIKFRNQGSDVADILIEPGEFGFNPLDISDYQTVNVPEPSIGFTDTEFDEMIFTVTTDVPSGVIDGFFIDHIRLVFMDNSQILNTTYLSLLDTFDTSFYGKARFTPVVVDSENGLILRRTPLFEDLYLGNAIINGGVVHITGLTYYVWATAYVINGVSYFDQPIGQNVTLDPADPTDPRIDVFAIFNDGSGSLGATVIDGVAESSPVKPNLDLLTQAEVSFKILFPGETTDNNINTDIIYNENLGTPDEWSNTGIPASSDADYAVDPNNGSVCYDMGIDNTVRTLVFVSPDDLAFTQAANLVFAFKTLGSWARPERLSIRINKDSSAYSDWININVDNAASFNLDLSGTNTDWQIVSVPFTQFNIVPLLEFNTIEIQLDTQNRVLFDYIRYQTGIVIPDPGITVQTDPETIYVGNINTTSSSNVADHINTRTEDTVIALNKVYFIQALVDGYLTTYAYRGNKPAIYGGSRTSADINDFKYISHCPVKVTGGNILKGGSNEDLNSVEGGDIAHYLQIENDSDPLTLIGQEFQSGDEQLRSNWIQKQTIDI